MEVNPLWNFKEAVSNSMALKQEYLGVLTLFSYKNIREKGKFIGETRKKIYSMQISDWQKDKIWEYMNDDIDFSVLILLRNRQRGQ